jgi:hypothetical protein
MGKKTFLYSFMTFINVLRRTIDREAISGQDVRAKKSCGA